MKTCKWARLRMCVFLFCVSIGGIKPILRIFKLGRFVLADSCWPIPNVFFLLRAHHVLLFVLFSCFFLTRRNHKRRVPLDDSPPATNYVNARMLHALQVWRIFIQICWHRHFVKVDKVHISRFSTCFFRCWRTAPTSLLAKACYVNQCVPNSHTWLTVQTVWRLFEKWLHTTRLCQLKKFKNDFAQRSLWGLALP